MYKKMIEEKRKLTKEELEDIKWEKAGFTRTEIKEMDKRAANIENAIPWGRSLGKNKKYLAKKESNI